MRIFSRLCLAVGMAGLLTACSGADLLNATIPSDGYRVVKDVVYADHERGTLDIYIPGQPAPGHPAVVFFYGGSWQTGSKDDYLFAGQALASKGIITVIADYRLYPQVYFPVFMDDAAEAFAWAHAHIADYGGDPRNLFVAGHSAGAYNAVMLSLDRHYLASVGGTTQWIRGTIGLSGPYDFLPLTDARLIALFGKRPAAETQPITYARPQAPPMLLTTGSEDTEVAPANSYRLAAKLKSDGDEVTVRTYPDLGHIGMALSLAEWFRYRAPTLDDISDFIHSHLATGK